MDSERPQKAWQDKWWQGEWRSLPGLNVPRVGATLVSMRGRLYCMGGCDEGARKFCDGAEEFLDWAPELLQTGGGGNGGTNSGRGGCGGGGSDDDGDGSWWEGPKEESKPGSAPQGLPSHWATVDWFKMPRALHAHTTAPLPRLLVMP